MIDFEAIGSLQDCGRLCGKPALSSATIKHEPEDFVVEEIPSYEPGGEGEHLFLWIEKRDYTTDQLRGHIARCLEISTRDVGVAGNKDRRAITRQFVSVPATSGSRVAEIDTPAIKVLDAKQHTNKLRTGHLRGNKFKILLRTTITPEQQRQCEESLNQLRTHGFVNYFGTQRFGGGETPRLGWELLTGKRFRRSMVKEFGRSVFRLSLSALQSAVFNDVASRRVSDESIQQVLRGDVLQFRDRRTHFVADDPTTEQPRIDSGEVVVTGPIHGRKMTRPTDAVLELEQQVLAQFQLPDDAFDRYPKLTMGTRRPLIRWPEELLWTFEPDGLRLSFTLHSGTYATVLMRELVCELRLAAPSAD